VKKLFKIARHEFLATAANKAFVVITLIGPFLILAISILPGLAASSGSKSGSVVALVGGGESLRPALASALGSGSSVATLPDEASATEGVLDGTYSAALVLEPGWESARSLPFYSKTGTDVMLYSKVAAVVDAASRQARAASSGVDPAVLGRILEGPTLDMKKLGADAGKGGSGVDDYLGILLTVMGFVMLMYMTVLLYGQLIGRSVLQEKTLKTVEIMLSSVSPRDLLWGKILGSGAAGLLQYAFWIGMALGATSLVGPALGIALPAALTPANLLWLVVFFIPAYFLYSALYAAMGAGAEDEQHLGQLAWPVLIFLIVPMVMINTFVMTPNSTLSVFFSFFPLTSPIVMLIRVLVSPPPAWQIAASYGLLVASVLAAGALAAKIFRVGILMTGKRRKLGEILKWVSIK
jgi:ABC-2 type transport system permease protein